MELGNYHKICLRLVAKEALPKPPLSAILGQKGVNGPNFCKAFNELTKMFPDGMQVNITLFYMKTDFKIEIRGFNLSYVLKKIMQIEKFAINPGREKISISSRELEAVVQLYADFGQLTGSREAFTKRIACSLISRGVVLDQNKI
jgi:large subunit ribosomal protein L11